MILLRLTGLYVPSKKNRSLKLVPGCLVVYLFYERQSCSKFRDFSRLNIQLHVPMKTYCFTLQKRLKSFFNQKKKKKKKMPEIIPI